MLSKSAQTVQNALNGLPIQVVELPSSTRTAEEAAKTLSCSVAQIVKSLIFRTKQTRKAILVLASGVNRVNEKLIAREVGEEIVRAEPDFVREKTGFAIGGVPPLGHKEKIETYIDRDLLSYDKVWAAAGTPNAVFDINPQFLENLTHGKIISICSQQ